MVVRDEKFSPSLVQSRDFQVVRPIHSMAK